MWLTHFWHSWSQFFIFAWDVTAGGILRTGVLICLVRSIIMCGMKLLIHPQTSVVQPLKFGNNFIFTLLGMWLLIRGGIKVNTLKKDAWTRKQGSNKASINTFWPTFKHINIVERTFNNRFLSDFKGVKLSQKCFSSVAKKGFYRHPFLESGELISPYNIYMVLYKSLFQVARMRVLIT